VDDLGIEAGSTVDRDTFVNQLSEKYGKKVWIECLGTRNVKNVVVCLSTAPPNNIVDCPPMTTPDAEGCAGELNSTLPSQQEPVCPETLVGPWLLGS